MLDIDDSALLHIALDYDPVKAHEYYLRRRQLKGRKTAAVKPLKKVSPGHKSTAVKLVKKKAATKQHATQADVTALKARFEHLRDVLAKLVEQAKARSGVETKGEKAKRQATSSHETKGKSPTTAQDRRVAAKRSRDYRKKHPTTESPSAAVARLQKQIADIEDKIHAAVLRAHAASIKHGSDHVINPTHKTAAKAVSTT